MPYLNCLLSNAATPIPPLVFPSASNFTNMDYLFGRKNDIEDPELDRDPFPWIIWYNWKARNYKLFRGIHNTLNKHNPLRYAW